MDTNYFVCTLGQAARISSEERDFKTIPEFLRRLARQVPNKPAVGFYKPTPDPQSPWAHRILTFGEIEAGVEEVARLIHIRSRKIAVKARCVALLCPSSPEFLFVWLALMRLGHSVLLIAPQCQPPAIAHLCEKCEVGCLYYDNSYEGLAQGARDAASNLSRPVLLVPLADVVGEDVFQTIHQHSEVEIPWPEIDEQSIAYLHHTSGTSTGVPKPIPQSHRAGIGVLPCLDGLGAATFTTTPLYHGGIADLFRAWTSHALIWLFPGKDVPITAGNIVRCSDIATQSSEAKKTPPVRYFSSVPYVLQMLAADNDGLSHLKAMDTAGVGGAALPADVGDSLVNKGVNLVSRFGSAECGFLLSSHRHYVKDKEWQYLRATSGAEFLSFESQGDGTSELVIKHGWPHMAKRNRDDGSFATADLFESHPTIPSAWKYHSRADSQLTLITGKKFDPAPLEAAIATSDLLQDVLIFGNGQPFPGALLFRSMKSQEMSDEELIQALAPQIEKLNEESQNHARLPRNMLVPMQYTEFPLEKSSKGTILRGAAESRYSSRVKQAYANLDTINGGDVPDDQVLDKILRNVQAIVGTKKEKLHEDTDLFSYGVDSVACMQIRYTLRQLLPEDNRDTPLTVVEDCGTAARLSKYVVDRRHGCEQVVVENEKELMKELVDEYSQFHQETPGNLIPTTAPMKQKTGDHRGGEVVLLTGATGSLGAHILSQYLALPTCVRIYCLVRGVDKISAAERIRKSLEQRGLDLSVFSPSSTSSKIGVLPAKLSSPRLGLSDDDYETLAKEATVIVHCAWAVNFRLRLRSFAKDHIGGVRNLINLALSSSSLGSGSNDAAPPRIIFCSSTASVSSYSAPQVPEAIIHSPAAASPLGYSRSKWVAEQVCYRAHCNTALRGRIAVLRIGQLSSDTKNGVWNVSEAWPLMLSTLRPVGGLPNLGGESRGAGKGKAKEELAWLPVDVAARAVVQIAENMGVAKRKGIGGVVLADGVSRREADEDDMVVCNVLNQAEPASTWGDLLRWLKDMGEEFEVVDPGVWVERLENLEGDHPAKKLLGIWKERYGEEPHDDKADLSEEVDGEEEADDEGKGTVGGVPTRGLGALENGDKGSGAQRRYRTERAELMAPLLSDVRPVDKEYVAKIWKWLKQEVDGERTAQI